MILIDELLKSKVALAATELNRPIYFMHGHIQEIVQELKKLSEDKESKAMRFPLVALLRDFPETKGQEIGIATEARFTLLIATRTEPTYNSEKRKAISFIPVLYPIWEAVEKQLLWSPQIQQSGIGLNYTQIDHYFWGKEGIYGSEANIFNDWIDCIEIRDLNLKIKQPNC
jgi:hypothetical protein